MAGRVSWPICAHRPRTFCRASQATALSGRSTAAQAWWKAASPSLTVPEPPLRRSPARWSRAQHWQGLGAELPGGLTDGTSAPELWVGVDAAGAQRHVHAAAAQRSEIAAPAAGHPFLLPAQAPRLADGPGGGADPRPQIPQSVTVRGRQLMQRGPSGERTATGRRRRQPRHSCRLAGSLIRQWGHNGPSLSSRAAGTRTAPQRTQGTAAWRAKQLRQTRLPSSSFDNAFTSWQRGQAGRKTFDAPAATSSSMNRSTAGPRASQPAPVKQIRPGVAQWDGRSPGPMQPGPCPRPARGPGR